MNMFNPPNVLNNAPSKILGKVKKIIGEVYFKSVRMMDQLSGVWGFTVAL